jgi:hypothetical protein
MAKRKFLALLIVLVCGLFLVGGVLASNGFAVGRSVIGGGGEEVTDGSLYILNGTLGEPIASDLALGTSYGLCSGFWCEGAGVAGRDVYLPIILRDYP